MEEIDIIELLKRVKEGKAPEEIEIDGTRLKKHINPNINLEIDELYETAYGELWFNEVYVFIDTKVKILDKPIIEELSDDDMLQRKKVKEKINEIVRCLNKGNKDER